ncbi:TPA: hypothetical protein L5U90_003474 [Pseudomonas aeruginosa]|nr:hypothetical protein [Pseudomonas aeruginosa]
MDQIQEWRAAATEIANRYGVPDAVLEVFFHMIEHIADEQWFGACHSSSTMLYILLKEHGIDSEIFVGDVKAPAGVFEHSWIEIDGAIFDAAVAFPLEKHVGGPVFAGYDLDTGEKAANQYGVGTYEGLSQETKTIAMLSIGTYYTWAEQKAAVECMMHRYPEPEPLWNRVARIARNLGLSTTSQELASKHFEIRRTFRSA